MEVPVLIK